MTIDDLGSLGEFLGAIAVFATLLFLAMQIRHANRSAEDTAVVMRSQSMREILLMLSRDPHLSSCYSRWLGASETEVIAAYEVGDEDVVRFGNLCLSVLVTLQSSWMTDRSAMGRRLTRSRLRWQFEQAGCRAVWRIFREVHFYDAFREEVDTLLAGIEAAEVVAASGAPEPDEASEDRAA